jgi:apolipoprotein D and lipocalin family protein
MYIAKELIMLKTLSFLIVMFSVSCANAQKLTTAEYVDIQRYTGKWYAITSLPQFFSKNCLGQSADYDIIDTQTISVLNTCFKKNKTTDIKGQAVVTNFQSNAELIVTFNNFFTKLFRVKGDYNIIKLDDDYRYVMVGSRNRKSLWIMAREKSMPASELKKYIDLAKTEKFPVEKLVPSQF